MVVTTALVTLLVAGGASLFMAWAIGAGSSGSTPFAPAVGANAITVMRAGFVVGILGLAGAVFQGANVSEAVGRELILGPPLTPTAVVIALLTAAILVAVGVYAGYPIATAFTVTGAVVGAGLALGGGPAWAKYRQIVSLWVLTPVVGGGVAYVTARLLRRQGADRWVVPVLGGLVGLVLANVRFGFFGPAGQGRSLAVALGGSLPLSTPIDRVVVSLVLAVALGLVLAHEMRVDAKRAERRFLLGLGGLVAFSAGGSQVGLAVGPLLPLVGGSVSIVWVLAGGGVGLLVGSWTGAPRMIKALAQDYSSLGPRRSIAALIPSFALAQAAVFLGVPVSFNEIIVSAIIGSGFAAGGSSVSTRKMAYTVLAWIGSLVLAGVVAYGAFVVVTAVESV